MSDLLRMDADRITKGNETDESGIPYKTKLLKLLKSIREIPDSGRWVYNVVILANVSAKVSSEQLKRLTGGFETSIYNYSKVYRELIFPVIQGTYYNPNELRITINLSNASSQNARVTYSVTTEKKGCDITIIFVPTSDFFSEPARNEFIAATKQCAARLQTEGIDLSGYTIPGVVQDMEAARKALGYQRINVLGASYGTRAAQIYAYLYPGSLRRIVLIGVNTPGRFIWKPADFDKMLAHINELCAKDTSCNSRTKNFSRTMYDVNRNMPKQWLFFDIDPDSVRFATQFMFFSNPNMTLVLDAYLAAGEGDDSGPAMMNLMVKLLPMDAGLGDQFNKGATMDGDKYRGIESISLGNSVIGAPLSESLWPAAQEWRAEMVPQKLRELQEMDVEMLLVNGTVDFSTPPSALDEVKPYFHKTQVVSLPEFSHVGDVEKLQSTAFERLVTSYYDTGVGDASLFIYQPLSFKPSFSLILAESYWLLR